jgi:hypothetical protein
MWLCNLRGLTIGLSLFWGMGLGPVRAQGQDIRGVVLSDPDRSPIEYAAVKLTDLVSGRTMTRLTDAAGQFEVLRAPGRVNLMEVSALGYHTHVDTVYVAVEENPLTLEIRLGVDAVPLEPLVVVASSRPVWESTQPEYLWEYFEREQFFSRLGMGWFFDRAELDRRFGDGGSLNELSTLIPVAIHRRELRETGIRCEGAAYFLDGKEWQGNAVGPDDEIMPDDPLREVPWGIGNLAAVEVYDDRFPVDFAVPNTVLRGPPPCRVVAMWTQRPVVPEGFEEESRDPGVVLPILALLGLVFGLVIGAG